MIGLGTEIRDLAEFNRRAAIALKGVAMVPGSWDKRFTYDMQRHIENQCVLTTAQQRAFFKVVRRYRRQISDQLVVIYAELNCKEAD